MVYLDILLYKHAKTSWKVNLLLRVGCEILGVSWLAALHVSVSWRAADLRAVCGAGALRLQLLRRTLLLLCKGEPYRTCSTLNLLSSLNQSVLTVLMDGLMWKCVMLCFRQVMASGIRWMIHRWLPLIYDLCWTNKHTCCSTSSKGML